MSSTMIDINDMSYNHNIARYSNCPDIKYDIYETNVIYVFYYLIGLYTLLIFFISSILTQLENYNKMLKNNTKYTLLLINSKFEICDDSFIQELNFYKIQKDIKKIGLNSIDAIDSDNSSEEEDSQNSQSYSLYRNQL